MKPALVRLPYSAQARPAPQWRVAQENCGPAAIEPVAGATGARVQEYRARLRTLRARRDETRLATRRLRIEGEELLLTVDPETPRNHARARRLLALRRDERRGEAETRFLQAVRPPADASRPPALVNAGLIHGKGDGAFVTGDLCPSQKPLDRAFIEEVAAQGPGTPLTLAVSGGWIAHHGADFAWLQEKARSGRAGHHLGGSLLIRTLMSWG